MGLLWINDSYSLLVLMNCSIRAFNLLIMFLSVTQLLAVMPASNRLTAMILQISLDVYKRQALGSGMFMGAPVQAMLVGGAASMGGAVGSSVGNLTDTAIHSRPATYVTSGAARRVSDVYTRTYNSDTRAGTVLRTAGGVRSCLLYTSFSYRWRSG